LAQVIAGIPAFTSFVNLHLLSPSFSRFEP